MSPGDQRRPLRVLVVDDCPDTRHVLALLLRQWGFAAAEAKDGVTALSAAAAFRPDVVLLDLVMPGLDGLEVARRLRGEPALAAVLLVAVTGLALPGDVARCLAAGFDRHLPKPVDPRLLRRLLDGHGSRRAD
jgi:two-component system CheB/CheR fusion protein